MPPIVVVFFLLLLLVIVFALPQESSQVSTSRTRLVVPRASPAKRSGPRTQLRRCLSNCPNQVREVKVRRIKNELSSRNLFIRFAELPELGSKNKSSQNSEWA